MSPDLRLPRRGAAPLRHASGAPGDRPRRARRPPHRHGVRHRRRRVRRRERSQRLLDAKGRGRSRRRPCSSPGSTTLARSSPRCPSPSSGSSRRSGPAGSRSSCRRSRRSPGTSARPTARSRCGCRRTASRSNCSRRPARSRSRARTSPACRRRSPRTTRRTMLGDSVAVYLDGGPSAHRRSPRRSSTRRASSAERDPVVRVLRDGAVDRAALREVLGRSARAGPERPRPRPKSRSP